MTYSYKELLYNSENKEIIATYHNNMEESQKYNVEQKKPDTKKYIVLMFTHTYTHTHTHTKVHTV